MSRLEMAVADHPKAMKALLTDCSRATGHRTWEVFTDWVAAMALSLANSAELNPAVRAKREEEYERLEAKHGPDNMQRFSRAMAHLISLLEEERTDALGRLYMQLELGNSDTGQFFTPYEVSKVMAALAFDAEYAKRTVEERGYVTVSEPACGAGGMLIAFAEHMREIGLNPQQQLHVTAVDIDITAVHMTFVQLSLLGVPAVVVHGNALTLAEWSHWRTPFHVVNLWEYRLRGAPEGAAPEPQAAPESSREPARGVVQPALFGGQP